MAEYVARHLRAYLLRHAFIDTEELPLKDLCQVIDDYMLAALGSGAREGPIVEGKVIKKVSPPFQDAHARLR